jgi:GTP-binding protein
MDITSVKFIKSSVDLKGCPKEGPAEYAFAGRSNVGKSSLLNFLANTHNLAKTSSTPGKTRLINHYLVNDNWYLVDLPGYGYARTGKKGRDAFLSILDDYLLHRRTLACLFILIDIRHKPLQSDLSFIYNAGAANIPLALIFTKKDKLSFTAVEENLNLYQNTLRQNWEELPPVFVTSTLKRTGREEILAFIEQSNAHMANAS